MSQNSGKQIKDYFDGFKFDYVHVVRYILSYFSFALNFML